MLFTPIPLDGADIVDLDPHTDERGFFARSWCQKEFAEHGLQVLLVQCNISYNRYQGTLRGMHLQTEPFAEAKLVRCTRGAIWDAIVDMRPASPTYLKHYAVELNAHNHRMLYVPEGFAHGFVTLENDTEIFYQMSEFYAPDHAVGYRYDDTAFGIQWPVAIAVISERDRSYPDYREQGAGSRERGAGSSEQ
jgi:dTDP-4-dehydrorhamnose 3,5-epimerase